MLKGMAVGLKALACIYPSETGQFWGQIPMFPGCITLGETPDEVEVNLAEAAELWLDGVFVGETLPTERLPYPDGLECVRDYYVSERYPDIILRDLTSSVVAHFEASGNGQRGCQNQGNNLCQAATALVEHSREELDEYEQEGWLQVVSI